MDRTVRNLVLAALCCAAGVALLALLFYGSSTFAELDARATARLLAPEGSGREAIGQLGADLAEPVPLVFFYVLLVAFAAAWKRPWQLAGAAVVILGANATTQGLKLVTSHPRVQGAFGVEYPIDIHYPSGHTTAALAVGVGLWLIAPPRYRRPAALAGAALGAAVGVGVVVAGWHFVSDVVGAALVVGFWACLVVAALVRAGHEGRPRSSLSHRR